MTFFLLTDESIKLVEQKKSQRPFDYAYDNYRISDQNYPEKAVAYDEIFIKNHIKKSGLGEIERIEYGSWADKNNNLSSQDIIITSKSE